MSHKNDSLRRRVRRIPVLALAPLALAIPLTGCGTTSLDSSDAHTKLVKQLQGVPGVNPDQANQIADCAVQEFKGQGYKNYDDVPKAKATAAGQDCAQKILTQGGASSGGASSTDTSGSSASTDTSGGSSSTDTSGGSSSTDTSGGSGSTSTP